ncbi:hypothetical protein PHMEG_00015630 [Phytophthora megakarya]|uniref:RZ-type domain-containing protein n=1 Tax=Phytophthora megakarya TaxID=4795 RepID=A0A225W2C3_9STRA|nr:hypothetical protein PHMEG_00015630 [Phytophthora megakarya]
MWTHATRYLQHREDSVHSKVWYCTFVWPSMHSILSKRMKMNQNQTFRSSPLNMVLAKKSVNVCCHVAIDAKAFVTGKRHVPRASVFVTCLAVNMDLAIIRVVIHAPHVRNSAAGAVSTTEIVFYRVELHAIAVYVTIDAQNLFRCPSICGEDCPSDEFCHICGDDDVKERVADVILFQTYGEIDPTEDPVLILPCCSTVYTMTTLDGTLHMSTYYDNNGNPSGPLPGDYIDTPQCPICKKPIRGIRRYGRVTKRAAIDAAEKNFISHSQRQLTALQQRANLAAEIGDLTQDKTLRRDLLCAFGATVKKPPCQKAFEACVAQLTKAKGGQGGGDVFIDINILPVPNSKFPYLGYFYLLSAQLSQLGTGALLNKAAQYARDACKMLKNDSFLLQANEAQLILVQILLSGGEEKLSESVQTEKERAAREKAVVDIASEADNNLGSLELLRSESFQSKHRQTLQDLRRRLLNIVHRARNASFYQDVSMEEMKAIKTAMQAEFSGSGHWYRCENGHSYTIGECGMAMEQTRCPECGAPVGGANHSFVEGTERDTRMDSL